MLQRRNVVGAAMSTSAAAVVTSWMPSSQRYQSESAGGAVWRVMTPVLQVPRMKRRAGDAPAFGSRSLVSGGGSTGPSDSQHTASAMAFRNRRRLELMTAQLRTMFAHSARCRVVDPLTTREEEEAAAEDVHGGKASATGTPGATAAAVDKKMMKKRKNRSKYAPKVTTPLKDAFKVQLPLNNFRAVLREVSWIESCGNRVGKVTGGGSGLRTSLMDPLSMSVDERKQETRRCTALSKQRCRFSNGKKVKPPVLPGESLLHWSNRAFSGFVKEQIQTIRLKRRGGSKKTKTSQKATKSHKKVKMLKKAGARGGVKRSMPLRKKKNSSNKKKVQMKKKVVVVKKRVFKVQRTSKKVVAVQRRRRAINKKVTTKKNKK